MAALLKDAAADIREIAFEQWIFDRQWLGLRARAPGARYRAAR